jgi:hypothetical protein
MAGDEKPWMVRQERRPDESRPGKRQEVEVVVEEVEAIRLLHGRAMWSASCTLGVT